MTGLALKLSEEQVATLLAQHGSSQVVCDIVSDWRTLRAALDEQVKENERQAEDIAEHERRLGLMLDRAVRAEAALTSANEIKLGAPKRSPSRH